MYLLSSRRICYALVILFRSCDLLYTVWWDQFPFLNRLLAYSRLSRIYSELSHFFLHPVVIINFRSHLFVLNILHPAVA